MLAALDTIAPTAPRPGIRVSGNPVQPQEAIDHFAKKAPLDKAAWLALSADARKRAFTAAWVTDVTVLQSVKDSLDKAIAEGQSFEAWKKGIRKELGEKWSRGDFYLETVFRNNVQSAYAAGRYKAQTTPAILKHRPYWRFVAILDDRTSDICRPLAKPPVILPATDPWWSTHWIPLHHRCRSTVTTLSRREAERMGISPKAPKHSPQEGWGSTAGLGEWQPTGEALDPKLFAPAKREAAKELPKDEPTVAPPAKVPEVVTRPPTKTEPRPAVAPPPKVDTTKALDPAVLAKRGVKVSEADPLAETSARVFAGKAPTIDALETAFSGGDVKAEVKYVLSVVDEDGATIAMKADLMRDGSRVGIVERRFTRKGRTFSVTHDFFKLDQSEQGKGIGEEILRRSLQLYAAIGVNEIALDAAWVGRYTWARFGFSWDSKTAKAIRPALEAYLVAEGVPAAEAKAIAAATHKNAGQVADIEVRGKKLGKGFLLSSAPEWAGKLRLDRPNDPGYIRAKERLRL